MPYNVQLPNGYVVEGIPDDMPQTEVRQRILAQFPDLAPPPSKGILSALTKGALSPLGSIQTGIESLMPGFTPEEAATKGIERQAELAKKYDSSANLEKVKKAYEEKGLLSAAGEAISQVPGAIAEQVPQMGAMFTGARLGAMAGSPLGPAGATFGAVVGAATPLLAQFYGTNIERQAQEQIKSGDPVKIDRGNAALASVPQTALDMVEARLLFGNKLISSALGIKPASLAKMSAEAVEKQATEKLIPLLAKGTLKGAAAEIPTEVAQQMIERAQAGLSLTSPDALAEYGDTAYQVGLLGPLGAVGRLSERGQARAELGKRAADEAILADQQRTPTMAAVPPSAPLTTQEGLFPKEEIPPQLTPDELAVGKKTIPAPQAPERAQSEIERQIFALESQGTPEALAQAEQLKQQLPQAPKAVAFDLGEEMMQLERKYKALEVQRDETKTLDGKNLLTQQMNQIRERQNEILKQGKKLEKEGVSFEAPPEQMGLNLENVITEDDFKTMGIGRTNKNLREAILGKSLANPEERAFIIDALTAYAEDKNRSAAISEKVGKFLEGLEEVPSEPTRTVPGIESGRGEPSVSMPSGQLEPTGGIAASTAGRLAGVEPTTGGPVAGEGAPTEIKQAPLGEELKGKATINLADRITQGDLKGALQDIATDTQYSELDRLIAQRLLESKTLPGVEIVTPEVTKGYPAQYDPNVDRVQITPGNIDSHSVMHETVHGFLHAMIRNSEAREAKGLEGNPKLKPLKDVYEHVKKERPDLAKKYGMQDLSEFASEAMSNPDFQNDLRNTPYKRINAFTAFAKSVLKLMGFPVDQYNTAQVDSLAAAIIAVEHAMPTGRAVQEGIQAGVRQQIEPDIARQQSGAFKKWFGDSKVVNPDGSPLVVYHGTVSDFSEFSKELLGKSTGTQSAKRGFFFGGKPEVAERFSQIATTMAPGMSIDEGYKNFSMVLEASAKNLEAAKTTNDPVQIAEAQRTYDLTASAFADFDSRHPNIMPVYLSMQNPLIVDQKGSPFRNDSYAALMDKAVREGRDGVIIKNTYDGLKPPTIFDKAVSKLKGKDIPTDTIYIVFEPNQIKSKFNKGTWSKETADIARLERTQAGTQAEQDMNLFGGPAPKENLGFIDRQRAKFNKTAEEWRASAERNDSKVAATFGKFQNIASFDQAFNNRLYNHFMGLKNQGIITLEEAKQALLRISTSQALHRTNLANQIIDRGNYTYDIDSNRWYAVDDDINMKKFEDITRKVAERLGVEPTRARQILGAAYEANRLNSMYKDLVKAEKELATAEADLTKLKDVKLKAKKRELVAALKEEVQSLTDKIQHKTPEQIEAGMRIYNGSPEIKEGTDVWNTMRKRIVKMLVDTGVKTEAQAEAWLDEAAYVPFFRDIEEEKAAGPNVMARGLRESMQDKRMRGSMKEVHDPIENMYKWMQWSIARAISNQQLNVMLDQYAKAIPHEVKEGRGPDSNTFSVYRDGRQRFFHVADPAIAQAFVGLEPIIFPGISWMTNSSNFLRHAVTRNPLFSAGQLFMDSYTAMFTSGLKSPFGVLKEIAKEVSATARGESATREALKKAGILETHDYAALTEADAIGQRLGLEKPGAWAKLAQRLDHLAAASDNVIRQGVYNQAIKEGLSHEEAMEKAAEIVNFRRVSGDPRIQFLSRIVPFFNAYLQVSSVAVKTLTGRGISPQERNEAAKVLAATTAKIAMISMLYSMAVGDDEDYKKKNRVSRDRMWMIPGSGGLGVPLRADIFALPKIIGEYSYQMMSDNGVTDSKMFKDAMSRAVMNTLAVPSEGIPQIVRPTLAVMTNHDFFQNREIVNATMRKLDVSEQYNKNTSEMARAFSAILGKLGVEASPLNIDYLLRGYLGTAGTLTALATNDILNPGRPSRDLQDILASVPNASAFVSKEENTAVLSDYYEAARDINKVVATASHLKNRPQEMRAYMEEHKKEYQLKGMAQAINNQLTVIKRQEMRIRESNKSPEQKQRELKALDERRSRMTAQIQKMRQRLYE